MNPNKKSFAIYGALFGILVLVIAIALKPAPPLSSGDNRATLVQTIVLEKHNIAPVIQGFGRVEPKNVWQAFAEVSGKVLYRHPQLETGRMLPKGTLVLTIDPLEYELKLAQANAAIHATQAQLTRLAQQERNLNTSLSLETKKLTLAEKEYQRKLSLKKRQLISNSELEAQNQSLLVQTKLVEDLQSALKLLPDDRKVTQAQLLVDEAKFQDANRRLKQTQVFLPFDARIAEVNIQSDQVASLGIMMFQAHQLGAAEIKAKVSVPDMRTLIYSLSDMPKEQTLPEPERLNITVQVSLQVGDNEYHWPAKLMRIAEMVDPNRASLGVYLEVAQDFTQMNFLERPPLTKGMFVSAHLTGQASPHFTVPERALHGEAIYIMDDNNALLVKDVTVLFRHNDQVAIESADPATPLVPGQTIVLNDLIPAIVGMALKHPNVSEPAVSESAQ